MGNTPEAVEAFKAGALDLICTVEPYASSLLNDVKGSVKLTDGPISTAPATPIACSPSATT